jgi:hypothetical protein
LIFPDGQVYKGMWFENQWHGLGEIFYPDGKYYFGLLKFLLC